MKWLDSPWVAVVSLIAFMVATALLDMDQMDRLDALESAPPCSCQVEELESPFLEVPSGPRVR